MVAVNSKRSAMDSDRHSDRRSARQAGRCADKRSDPRAGRHAGWQLPSANGPFWLLTALTLGCACWLWTPPPALPTLRPTSPPPCPVPVEVPEQGVRCLSPQEALRLGLLAGDVWPLGPRGEPAFGPPGRMAPRRLLAVQVPLDPQTATAAELEALPEVGPQLAQRIVTARKERAARGEPPLRRRADLLQIAGLGERRLQRLLPFLISLQ